MLSFVTRTSQILLYAITLGQSDPVCDENALNVLPFLFSISALVVIAVCVCILVWHYHEKQAWVGHPTISSMCSDPSTETGRVLIVATIVSSLCLMGLFLDEWNARLNDDKSVIEWLYVLEIIIAGCATLVALFPSKGRLKLLSNFLFANDGAAEWDDKAVIVDLFTGNVWEAHSTAAAGFLEGNDSHAAKESLRNYANAAKRAYENDDGDDGAKPCVDAAVAAAEAACGAGASVKAVSAKDEAKAAKDSIHRANQHVQDAYNNMNVGALAAAAMATADGAYAVARSIRRIPEELDNNLPLLADNVERAADAAANAAKAAEMVDPAALFPDDTRKQLGLNNGNNERRFGEPRLKMSYFGDFSRPPTINMVMQSFDYLPYRHARDTKAWRAWFFKWHIFTCPIACSETLHTLAALIFLAGLAATNGYYVAEKFDDLGWAHLAVNIVSALPLLVFAVLQVYFYVFPESERNATLNKWCFATEASSLISIVFCAILNSVKRNDDICFYT